MTANQSNHAKPDCVVIDSNVWRSELLLRTPLGVSLTYALGKQRGFIGLPEVVEMELAKQIEEVGSVETAKLENSARKVSVLTNKYYPSFSPRPGEFREIVTARLAGIAIRYAATSMPLSSIAIGPQPGTAIKPPV